MPSADASTNLRIYNAPEVASHYAALAYLSACEQYLFSRYIRPGMAILDLGVGGGRTTPYLARDASRYVGADYAEEMIRACRNRFPGREFAVTDASDLSAYPDASFDVIVAAFNGMDYVLPEEKRLRCLEECWRVLRKNGLLIFSSHNPRAVLVLPHWEQERVRKFSERLAGNNLVLYSLILPLATLAKGAASLVRAAAETAKRAARRVSRKAFLRGEGCMMDPAHGGLLTHYWIPRKAIAELRRLPFECLQVVGDDYPRRGGILVTDWYYYVFAKRPAAEG